MRKHVRHPQPWDRRGQVIQLALIVLVTTAAGVAAYAGALIAARLVNGGPPPFPEGR